MRILQFVALLVTMAIAQACGRAEAGEIDPTTLNVLVEFAPGDTARVIAAWGIVQGSFPIGSFTTRIVDGEDATIRSGSTPAAQRADTLILPDLVPGETYGPYRFGVVPVDDRDNAGIEAFSDEFTVTRGFTPPSITDVDVTIDTLELALERAGWRSSLGVLPDIEHDGSGIAEYEIVGEGGHLLACEQVLLVDTGDSLVVAGREWCPDPLTFALVVDPETGERLNPVQLVSELTYSTRPIAP